MARMGHASSRAALIYQHATKDRDAAIAAALSDLIENATARATALIEPIRVVKQPGKENTGSSAG